MSIIGDVVTFGGGGMNFPSGNAVLQVTAPTGSTVSITNGTVTKTTSDGHAISDRGTASDYYFSIAPADFGTFTVTGTRSGETGTASVTVSSNLIYSTSVWYHVPILEYQEVEYLESNETPYINTGITYVDGADVDFQYTKTYSGTAAKSVFGSRPSSGSVGIFSMTQYNGNMVADPYALAIEPVNTNRHRIQSGAYIGWQLYYDGVAKIETPTTLSTSGRPIGLFGEMKASSVTATPSVDLRSACKIFSAKLYQGDTLVSEMYPCLRLSDSTPGMYDKVNSVFRVNSNSSGAFTYGGAV